MATVITLPYGVLVGVLLYLDLRARKENLTLETAPDGPAGINHLVGLCPARRR